MLLEGNPLTDIRNVAGIVGVVVRGHWYLEADIAQQRPPNQNVRPGPPVS